MIAALVLAASARVLTLEDALATAAQHQPQIVQAHATTDVYSYRADEARAAFLPQVNGVGTYQRRTSNFAPTPGLLPGVGGTGTTMGGTGATTNSFETVNNYNFGITLSQQLFDWGSLSRYRTARVTVDSQAAGEKNVVEQIQL